jgi:predicted TIM-barrel fold metal-dependent hydrolase
MNEPDYEETSCVPKNQPQPDPANLPLHSASTPDCCLGGADAGHAGGRWPVNRRALLTQTTAALLGGHVALRAPAAAAAEPAAADAAGLALKDFQPKSMLHVPETRVPRARFPVIDIHTHLCFAASHERGVPLSEERTHLAPTSELLEVMDHCNIQLLANVTGGMGRGLRDSVQRYDRTHPGRFVSFTEPWWSRAAEPGYAQFQADELAGAKRDGARGLKVLKVLGLYLRDPAGSLIPVDDRRFDPMWEACAGLHLPVTIHVSDPEAFYLPIDRFNERYEELNNHPDWSFHGRDFPSNAEVLAARNRMFARHPKTQFIALHVGNDAENLASVSECLDEFPNMHVDLGARIGELGRQPRTARRFFDRYQDRILFGTDATPHGNEYPQQLFGNALYEIYYRFLQTEDEYFDYAPAAVPPQGRWRIYGLGLPDGILRKVYHDNAARLLGLPAL